MITNDASNRVLQQNELTLSKNIWSLLIHKAHDCLHISINGAVGGTAFTVTCEALDA
jgi:hypothetical protein